MLIKYYKQEQLAPYLPSLNALEESSAWKTSKESLKYISGIIAFNSSAVQFDNVAGYIAFVDNLHDIEILNIYVAKSLRGLGIAKQMLRSIPMFIKKESVKAFLEFRRSNVPAKNLYERFGFVPLKIRKHYYTCPVEDCIAGYITIGL